MKYGCTTIALVAAAAPVAVASPSPIVNKTSLTPPNNKELPNKFPGMGTHAGSWPMDKTKPYENNAKAVTPPQRGPAMATSKKSDRFSGMDFICVIVPNVPNCPLGIKYGMDNFTFRMAPTTRCPTSCAREDKRTPAVTGKAASTYATVSKFSNPGGGALGSMLGSIPAAPPPSATQRRSRRGTRASSPVCYNSPLITGHYSSSRSARCCWR